MRQVKTVTSQRSHDYYGVEVVSENFGGYHTHSFVVECRRCGKKKSLDMPIQEPLDGQLIEAAWEEHQLLPIWETGCVLEQGIVPTKQIEQFIVNGLVKPFEGSR